MNITSTRDTVRAIRPDDPNFIIKNQFILTPRAALEISPNCPYNHLQVIQTCIDRGWIKPVAHVTERELLFMGLSKE